MRTTVFTSALVLVLLVASLAPSAEPTRALIIEGQNNHGIWPKTSKLMKSYLEQTKLF